MSTPDLDVQAFINRHPFSPYQWLVFVTCFVIVLLDGFDTAAIGFALTSLAVFMIGQVAGSVLLLTITVFVSGTLMNTAQSSLPALAAAYYPTQGRATGVAWMLGIGRFGGIACSLVSPHWRAASSRSVRCSA